MAGKMERTNPYGMRVYTGPGNDRWQEEYSFCIDGTSRAKVYLGYLANGQTRVYEQLQPKKCLREDVHIGAEEYAAFLVKRGFRPDDPSEDYQELPDFYVWPLLHKVRIFRAADHFKFVTNFDRETGIPSYRSFSYRDMYRTLQSLRFIENRNFPVEDLEGAYNVPLGPFAKVGRVLNVLNNWNTPNDRLIQTLRITDDAALT